MVSAETPQKEQAPTAKEQEPKGPIEQAVKAIEELRVEDAIALLEQAKKAGPYRHDEHVRVYENMGIAYAYAEKPKESVGAFERMLALDPSRAISYTLSPKVTFLFERARARTKKRGQPELQVSYPRGAKLDDSIKIGVEVVQDPAVFFERAKVFSRVKGQEDFRTAEVKLRARKDLAEVSFAPPVPEAQEDKVFQFHLIAYDEQGNEVYQWASPKRPRELALRYVPPEAWYKKWWVWAIVGGVVAAGAGGAAAIITSNQSTPTVPGRFEVLQ